ncbi:ATP-binding protein [Acidovorax sp. LjRoot117]|uniref:ATP-binding protein n=1 Tax=Acidovorax sp. LjRoot117 TaxID=3342255 RepID=UPI003ECEF1E1
MEALREALDVRSLDFNRVMGRSMSAIGRVQFSCSRHGEYMATGTRLSSRDIWTSCPGCKKDREDQEAAEKAKVAARMEAQAKAVRLEQAAIPQRFIDRTLDTFKSTTPEQQRAFGIATEFASNFEHHYKKGSWLVFSGLPGTGKSHLAAGILQAIMPAYVGRYFTCMEVIQHIRSTWRKDSEASEVDLLAEFGRVPLLVIDEIGMQYGTESEQNHLFDVLDRRYRDMMPTILLTNQNKDGFRQYVGDRIYDRMTECARWVPFPWESYRPIARKEIAE